MGITIKKSSSMRKEIERQLAITTLNKIIEICAVTPALEGTVFDSPIELQELSRKFVKTFKFGEREYTEDEGIIISMIVSIANDVFPSDEPPYPYIVFDKMVCASRVFHKGNEIESNPFLSTIKYKDNESGNAKIVKTHYDKYELLIYNTAVDVDEGLDVPSLGTFDHHVSLPAIEINGEIKASVSPATILTMKKPIEEAHGKVLTLGCNMGYFAYMAAAKVSVESVTIIEPSDDIIHAFSDCILSQFDNKDKIKIIKADPFEYMSSLPDGQFDYCFADICVDAIDFPSYLKLRRICKKFSKMKMSYWIEDSLLKTCHQMFKDIILSDDLEDIFADISDIETDSIDFAFFVELIKEYIKNTDICINAPDQLREYLSLASFSNLLTELL